MTFTPRDLTTLYPSRQKRGPWIMTSKRFKGGGGFPPHVEFRIGAVPIADIIMTKHENKWAFRLFIGDFQNSEHTTFGDALRELHNQLNSPPPEGFEVYSKKQHGEST